jgi:prepilin-type N-terminal cleavage/methylation domain-containing protein
MRRQAFTLVEMMVSMALVLFIMVLLSQAFQAGLESFRLLKSIGDMDEKMRGMATLLRRDLAADHFEGRRRISDDSFWTQGPPREGFFRIWHGSGTTPSGPNNFIEGLDGDGLPSTRATDHTLHFSVKLRGNKRQDFVSATLPASSPLLTLPSNFFNQAADARYQEQSEYSSQWFEVAYYLRQTGTTLLPNSPSLPNRPSTAPGTPLFALIRRQLVAVPDNTRLNWGTPVKVYNADDLTSYAEMSCKKTTLSLAPQNQLYPSPGDPLYFNNPTDLTVPPRRFGMLPRLGTSQLTGRKEDAGLPSIPLLDPNDASVVVAEINRRRISPMLGEMNYQHRVFGDLPIDWPTELRSWFVQKGVFADSFTNVGLPVVWQDYPKLQGADVLLTNVVSFEVKVLVPGAIDFADLFTLEQQRLLPTSNSVFRGTGPRVFDTWSSVRDDTYDYSHWSVPNAATSAPAQIRILALQITLRIWDQKTQQTRQITLVQDM